MKDLASSFKIDKVLFKSTIKTITIIICLKIKIILTLIVTALKDNTIEIRLRKNLHLMLLVKPRKIPTRNT